MMEKRRNDQNESTRCRRIFLFDCSPFLLLLESFRCDVYGRGASWSMDLFAAGLEYTGIFLPALSVVNLIVGVIYLILAESAQIKEFIMKRKVLEDESKYRVKILWSLQQCC